MMSKECLICGKPLIFLQNAEEKECHFCHKKCLTNTICEENHYVCDHCHAIQGIKSVLDLAKQTESRNPIEIATKMMHNSYIHLHGNEHHVLVGAALLAAYHNAGGTIDLEKSLLEIEKRGKQVPGGVCGFWGACGAAISTGIFISIITGSTPLKNKEWGLSNLMTSESLKNIGQIGGPRCCKRNSFIAIQSAVEFCADNLGIQMELPEKIICTFNQLNDQCIEIRCPFFSSY